MSQSCVLVDAFAAVVKHSAQHQGLVKPEDARSMTTRKPRHLFVYGTLRSDARHEMSHVLARSGTYAGVGTVKARLFDLGEATG